MTAEGPGVSVVIPAYNYARYLPSAIESVLAQTYSHLEVIVVDDGSTDTTREIVAGYADPRVRYIWQSNAGLSAARNTGIRAAAMEYVGFLDADDRWRPGFLSEVMGRFARLEPQYAAIATVTERIDENGAPWPSPRFNFDKEGELTSRHFILRNRPLSSSVVVRRIAFEECGFFDTALRSSEDRDMWIRITARHRFWLAGSPLAVIRRHGANMSKNAMRMKRNSRDVILKAWRAQAVSRLDLAFWLRVFSVHFFQIAWTHFDAGLRFRAFGYLFISILLWPFFVRPAKFFEPPLFRIRALANFCLRSFRSMARTPQA